MTERGKTEAGAGDEEAEGSWAGEEVGESGSGDGDGDDGGSEDGGGRRSGHEGSEGGASERRPPRTELSVEDKTELLPTAERERLAGQLRLRGKQALANRDFEDARTFLNDAIILSPSSYKLYRLRSVAHACCKDYQSSLEDAEEVIKLAPNMSDGFYHKGFALYHLRRFSEAANAFQDGLKLSPQDRALRQGFWDAVTLLSQDGVAEDFGAKMKLSGDDGGVGERQALSGGAV